MLQLWSEFLDAASVRRRRSIREFAESEVIVPDGPYKGFRFSCSTQPFAALLFDEMDSGRWRRFNALGPPQSGKTLMTFVIVLLYYLFELRESVILAVPSEEMGGDKWREDLLPAIKANPAFESQLPTTGEGARGGVVRTAVRFRNGATLKIMSTGASHARLSGFTARVVMMTELDKLNARKGGASGDIEASKVRQLFARGGAYGEDALAFMEGTITTPDGLSWSNHSQGSGGELWVRCVYCGEWSLPRLEHLTGWQDAENEVEAGEQTRCACSKCGGLWDETQRQEMLHDMRLVHRGQSVSAKGVVTGDLPRTLTGSFRWNFFHNAFKSLALTGQECWAAAHAEDEEDAERAIMQHVAVEPVADNREDTTLVTERGIYTRLGKFERGAVPEGAACITAHVDVGKYLLHWSKVAHFSGGSAAVIDYGVQEVVESELGTEVALPLALNELDDMFFGGENKCTLAGVDMGGEWASIVQRWVTEAKGAWIATRGFGFGQERRTSHIKREKSVVVAHGDGYVVTKLKGSKARAVEMEVDRWKTFVHARFACSPNVDGAWRLFVSSDRKQHFAFAKHLTAEREERVFSQERGWVSRWVAKRKSNHWLDTMVGNAVLGHLCGIRVGAQDVERPRARKPRMKRHAPAGDAFGRKVGV